jgi:hypothetical protein
MKNLPILFCVLFAAYACDYKKKAEQSSQDNEDFKLFLTRFDRDSLFQKSRVRFSFKTKVDLRISKIDTALFNVQTINQDSVTVIVTYKKDASYWIKLIFKTEEGKWFLVNYLDSYND